MTRIHVLERSVAERIAAGEVIERPASVVKELVENSLDAGARTITVEAEGAGLRVIRVTDDGEGIPPDQVGLAFERFATSKIARVEDLERVTSYGFRGEALPSIAAVARVTLTTRTQDATSAVRVTVAGGEPQAAGAHGAPPGTMVEVISLFYNTPARLKFLRSPSREQALLAEALQHAAMAHPEVAFRLVADGREAGRWPRTEPVQRVAELLGAGGSQELVQVRGAVPAGSFHGWLGRPEHGRPNRTGQHVFVNHRPVQSALLRRAVEQGYAQLMPVGRFPAFALFVEVDPAALDVNVHPRKMEVRFGEESRLFGAVAHGIREALLSSPLIRHAAGPAVLRAPAAGESLALLPGAGEAAAREAGPIYGSAVPQRLPVLRPVGQLLNTYVLAEGHDGLYLVDQHAAHERVLYERLIAARRRGSLTSQGLAVPLTVELTPAQMALLVGQGDRLAQMGFEVEPFGSSTAILRAVPAAIPDATSADLLLRALGSLQDDGEGEDPLERIAIATACHTAIRAGDRLSPEAISALLADLNAAEDPFTCFHGRPTIIALSREQIERWFLRG